MSIRPYVLILLSFVLILIACTDSTTPLLERDDEEEEEIPPVAPPDSVPHDFVVTTDPDPVAPGKGAVVSARWSDSNLNATGVTMTLEGARIVGEQTLDRNEDLQQYECRQWMVMPDTFRTNQVHVQVSDPDSQVTHVHGIGVEGGWPPPNTPPHDTAVSFLPLVIGAGQTVTLALRGIDDENNMVPGIAALYASGAEVQVRESSVGYSFVADTHQFTYSLEFVAPPDTGTFVVELTVRDLQEESHVITGSFRVVGSNRPPFFTEIQIEDRIVQGISDRLGVRVSAMDPNRDDLILLRDLWYGSMDMFPIGESHGDTTVWKGSFIPSGSDTAFLTFFVSDQMVGVSSETYTIVVDHSGRPVLDQFFVTDGNGTRSEYDPYDHVGVFIPRSEELLFEILAHDPRGEDLTYDWAAYMGDQRLPATGNSSEFTLTLPDYSTIVTIECTVTDPEGYHVRPLSVEVYVE